MKRIRPFFVHCAQDQDYSERLDTIMMPNGSIAALSSINNRLREKYDFLEADIAVDESYLGQGKQQDVYNFLLNKIQQSLSGGEEPVIFCTVLSYNTERTLELLKFLKQEFGSSIRTGVGGQLVRVISDTYRFFSFVDHVGVGDAEVILEPLMIGKTSFISRYMAVSPKLHYSSFSYENYVGIEERLGEMSQLKFGPFSGFRQLAIEGVRGCSWAHSSGRACGICSLESIIATPFFKPFKEYFALENQLVENFGINWMFDISNQFIPVMGDKNQERWLQSFLEAKKKYEQYEINRYVYLTSNSISERTAPLLRKAGIRLAYIGLDGWDTGTRNALNKPQTDPRNILRICRENDIYVRLGIVIGSGINKQNLQVLPVFEESIIKEFKETILTWGNFLEIILPGSRVWYDLEERARQNGWSEITKLYHFFYCNGYLTWPQQEKMTEYYIRLVQQTDYDEVVAIRNQVISIIKPYTIPITFRDGGHLEKV